MNRVKIDFELNRMRLEQKIYWLVFLIHTSGTARMTEVFEYDEQWKNKTAVVGMRNASLVWSLLQKLAMANNGWTQWTAMCCILACWNAARKKAAPEKATEKADQSTHEDRSDTGIIFDICDDILSTVGTCKRNRIMTDEWHSAQWHNGLCGGVNNGWREEMNIFTRIPKPTAVRYFVEVDEPKGRPSVRYCGNPSKVVKWLEELLHSSERSRWRNGNCTRNRRMRSMLLKERDRRTLISHLCHRCER